MCVCPPSPLFYLKYKMQHVNRAIQNSSLIIFDPHVRLQFVTPPLKNQPIEEQISSPLSLTSYFLWVYGYTNAQNQCASDPDRSVNMQEAYSSTDVRDVEKSMPPSYFLVMQ